ncbi:PREDICTED: uncharacterized protein LOC109313004 [Crocodylus porosus]|uniref:uncharacterized protein LOC109313004 n=1 Tax=Crocodylus porosus TaxID=8502 RepID=UPI0009396069|nr:PREDICTED: uncharacterized protein LOC109313004 [Crocodylus porosus]
MAVSILMMMISSLLGEFLSLGAGALRCPGVAPIVAVAEGEPVSFECPFNGHPTHNNTFHEIIWLHTLSHTNPFKRILSIRMNHPNDSATVTVTEGHLRGQLDFEKHISFLSIPEVRVNDSGLYYCEVTIVPPHIYSKTNATNLIVQRGWPTQITSESSSSHSAPEGGTVTLTCGFTANTTGNFTQLFWIHELSGQAQFRLIAWHGLAQRDGTYCGTGSRFHSQLDLDKHRSCLTITGLQVNDSGWYHCEGLGHPGRGSSSSLIVKAPTNIMLIFRTVAGLLMFLLALCLCFTFRYQIHAKNQEVSLEMSHLNSNTSAPAERDPLPQLVVSSLGRSPHSEDPGAKKKSEKRTDGISGTNGLYAVVGGLSVAGKMILFDAPDRLERTTQMLKEKSLLVLNTMYELMNLFVILNVIV